jgi:hypothetical protein
LIRRKSLRLQRPRNVSASLMQGILILRPDFINNFIMLEAGKNNIAWKELWRPDGRQLSNQQHFFSGVRISMHKKGSSMANCQSWFLY